MSPNNDKSSCSPNTERNHHFGGKYIQEFGFAEDRLMTKRMTLLSTLIILESCALSMPAHAWPNLGALFKGAAAVSKTAGGAAKGAAVAGSAARVGGATAAGASKAAAGIGVGATHAASGVGKATAAGAIGAAAAHDAAIGGRAAAAVTAVDAAGASSTGGKVVSKGTAPAPKVQKGIAPTAKVTTKTPTVTKTRTALDAASNASGLVPSNDGDDDEKKSPSPGRVPSRKGK